MLYVSKAAYNTLLMSNVAREDLSPTITLTATRPRPISQAIGQVRATNTIHKWDEVGRNGVGRVAAGATFVEGNLPPTAPIAPNKPYNQVCHVGETAQVTDTYSAVFDGGGEWQLAQGEEVRLLQNALDYAVQMTTLDVLDQIEWMHVSGDSSQTTLAGGETDGIVKWITSGAPGNGASGIVVNSTVNAGASGTTTAPVAFQEAFIKDGARVSAEAYPSFLADTLLTPPELIPDFNGFVANGAARPVVQLAGSGENGTMDLVAGVQVGWYNTGYSVLKVVLEPNLSPLFNPNIAQPAVIGCNLRGGAIKQANLIKLGAEMMARTDLSVRKAVSCVFAQEHRNAAHAFIIPNVKSAVA